MQKSDFIPNTFTHPNAYVDRLMGYLTPEENTVLTYLVRRIFGFRKRTDRVALSQFVDGIKGGDGQHLDHGTGLSKDGVSAALRCLIAFNIVIVEAPNNRMNEGTEYSLQLDSEAVNWVMIHEREATRQAMKDRKNAKLRKIQAEKHTPIYGGGDDGQPMGDPPGSELPPRLATGEGGGFPTGEGGGFPQEHNIQRNPEKSSVRQPKKAGARDPRLDHPAIKLVRETLRRYPDKGAWDSIIEALGEEPDGERFKQVYAAWTLRGFKPTNLEGLLNWYKSGIPEHTGKYSAPAQAPAPQYEFVYLEE